MAMFIRFRHGGCIREGCERSAASIDNGAEFKQSRTAKITSARPYDSAHTPVIYGFEGSYSPQGPQLQNIDNLRQKTSISRARYICGRCLTMVMCVVWP